MKSSGPETGYGYMEVDAPVDGAPGVHAVARFIEKPDARKRRGGDIWQVTVVL